MNCIGKHLSHNQSMLMFRIVGRCCLITLQLCAMLGVARAEFTQREVAQAKKPLLADVTTENAGHYDVVIVGGSTAALAAAFTAAEEGAKTALLEPTDWIGGQLTASGVPAVDEAWHRIVDDVTGKVVLDVSAIARDPRNMTPFFRDTLAKIGNPGKGWVSRYCFEPKRLLEETLLPREKSLATHLTVFRNTVIKSVEVDRANRQVTSLTAIQRTAVDAVEMGKYDRLLSEDLPDWYSREASTRYSKKVLKFFKSDYEPTIFIDATEWGELLALSDAAYLVGVDDSITNDQDVEESKAQPYGQAVTFGFVQRYNAEPAKEHPKHDKVEKLGYGSYRDKPNAWPLIWTYRRLLAESKEPSPGDLSLQNWGFDSKTGESGNDYADGYLFLSKQATAEQVDNWQGGVDLEVLAAAERQAFAWHDWFRNAAPKDIDPNCITIEGAVLGTTHGLSKVPYIRDTRRSIGLDNFLIHASDLTGPAGKQTGTKFADRIALGAYAADIHPMAGRKYLHSDEIEKPTLPFYIPYRALTNRDYDNLLVAGKTMAQTFMANSAIRLHPIEWSSGCAAGAAASYLVKEDKTTREGLDSIINIQSVVRGHTPIDWQIDL